MLYLKNTNELIYVGFSKQDWNRFTHSLCKNNTNKISVIAHDLESDMFKYLAKIALDEKYNNIKIIVYNATDNNEQKRIYNRFIRNELEKYGVSKRVKLFGGRYYLVSNGMEYTFYKNSYTLKIYHNRRWTYSSGASLHLIYCDLFSRNGLNVNALLTAIDIYPTDLCGKSLDHLKVMKNIVDAVLCKKKIFLPVDESIRVYITYYAVINKWYEEEKNGITN